MERRNGKGGRGKERVPNEALGDEVEEGGDTALGGGEDEEELDPVDNVKDCLVVRI